MKSFETPNKLKTLYYDSGREESGTTPLSVDKRSTSDRDRRRQIIAKLAQKRKQYQRGIGKAERESFQQRVQTSIIKHKQKEKLENKSIKALKPTKAIIIKNNINHQKDEHQEEHQEEHKSVSISESASLSISPIHHNESMYNDDIRDKEIRTLRAQNQRLSNKLKHVNTELVETSVFLRSERKRNKNLFNELKMKERDIQDLTENIDQLELEIEEKDKKCVECVERLSETEQRKNALNTNLSNKIKQSYNDIKEWQNKYYDIFEKYSNIKSKHKQQINDQNIEMMKRKESIHSIIKLLQNQIKCNDNSVSKQLNEMLYKENELDEINILLQTLIGVIDKSHQQNQYNNELTLCLAKYEKDIQSCKCTIIEQEKALHILNKEKVEIEKKANKTTKELQKLYDAMFTATNELQNIAVQITNRNDIGDININQCIEIIADSVNNDKMNIQKLKTLLKQVMMKHLNQMDAVQQIFRNVSGNWSQRIHGLQDRLSHIQIELLRTNGANAANVSNMSMISDVNKSFRVDDIELQCSQQIVLINELKDEIDDKQKTIECLVEKSEHIQQSKYEKICKERDDALSDFQQIAEEWQNMEKHIETTYNNNETLKKQVSELTYWINYMVNYMNEHVNGADNASSFELEFESISNDIPSTLQKLHSSLMYILTRMDLSALNDTVCDDINDDALLEQLFGKIEVNQQESPQEMIDKLETEMCLESIIHKIELSHVGNEAEKLIFAYQKRLKAYHGFIRELQDKVSQSSKLIHSITLERDHIWSQCKRLETEVTKSNKENTDLRCILSQTQNELKGNTEDLTKLKKETTNKIESMIRQLRLNETTHINMHKRLNESAEWIQQITKQRDDLQQLNDDLQQQNDDLQQQNGDLQQQNDNLQQQKDELQQQKDESQQSFIQYKKQCDVMLQSVNPLMVRLNQYSSFNDRVDRITEKIKCLKDYLKCDQIHKKQKKHNEIQEIKKECEKSAISKLRMHADIHRFHFAKLLQEMKQKYEGNIQQLQERIASAQSKFIKIQNANSNLQNQFDIQNQDKIMIQSQLIQIKESFNTEIVNYQSVHNQNNEIINNLQNQLDEKDKYSESIQHQNQINITKREHLQEKLNEQTKKTKKLHTKNVKAHSELKIIKAKCAQFEQQLQNAEHETNDYNLQIEQLEALNQSLNQAMNTKDINHNKMSEIYNTKMDELKEVLQHVQTVNNNLNNKYEIQQNELRECKEMVDKLESINNVGIQNEREWIDKEEDLRTEINIIRKQFHETTNDLGMMKLDVLEKETFIKKLQNEINGLNEEVLFYKECQEKDKNEKEVLSHEISEHSKSHEQKINDIKMIMDAKSLRIMKLQQDLERKSEKIKALESQLIQKHNNENSKLQMIINDLSKELQLIKTEKGDLYKELEIQKNVNVQLSIELDSIKQRPTTDDVFNRYSNLSFFDEDLEKKATSYSLPNMESNNHDIDVDQEILNQLNLPNANTNPSNNQRKRKPKLPIPGAATSQSSSKLPVRIHKNSCRSLFGGNAEEVDYQ